jgi:hypothetical protein
LIPFEKTLIAILLAAATCSTHGAGLGKLTIVSSLGEPLNAEIDLIATAEEDLVSLDARLASAEIYSRRDVRLDPALLGTRVIVMRREDGQPYLRITSRQPINEPTVDLLIEVSWNDGHLLRAFSAFVDPPGYAAEVRTDPLTIAVAPRPDPLDPNPSRNHETVAPVQIEVPTTIHEPFATDRAPRPSHSSGTALARTDTDAKPPAPPRGASAKLSKPLTGDTFRVTGEVVEEDRLRELAAAALATRERVQFAQMQSMQNQLREMNVRIAAFQAGDLSERVRSLEASIAVREIALQGANQQIRELLKTLESRSTFDNSIASATRMVAPIAVERSAASHDEARIPEGLLVVGGSALVLAIAGGLGVWRFRRRNGEGAHNHVASTWVADASKNSESSAFEHSPFLDNASPTKSPVDLNRSVQVLGELAEKKNVVEFNRLARIVAALTGRQGQAWEKIATIGGMLDQSNLLYFQLPSTLADSARPATVSINQRNWIDGQPIVDITKDWMSTEYRESPTSLPVITVDSGDCDVNVLTLDFGLETEGNPTPVKPRPDAVGDYSQRVAADASVSSGLSARHAETS